MRGVGEFDAQSHLDYFKDKWMLYTRANCAAHGHRQLQVSIGNKLAERGDCQRVCSAGLNVGADIYLGHAYRADKETPAAITPIAQTSEHGQLAKGGIDTASARS